MGRSGSRQEVYGSVLRPMRMKGGGSGLAEDNSQVVVVTELRSVGGSSGTGC